MCEWQPRLFPRGSGAQQGGSSLHTRTPRKPGRARGRRSRTLRPVWVFRAAFLGLPRRWQASLTNPHPADPGSGGPGPGPVPGTIPGPGPGLGPGPSRSHPARCRGAPRRGPGRAPAVAQGIEPCPLPPEARPWRGPLGLGRHLSPRPAGTDGRAPVPPPRGDERGCDNEQTGYTTSTG